MFVGSRKIFDKRSTGDTEFGHFSKFSDQKLVVIPVERDVCIEITDQLEFQIPDSVVSGVEAMGFGSKLALATNRQAKQFYPVVLNCVGLRDVVCPVGRAIADD